MLFVLQGYRVSYSADPRASTSTWQTEMVGNELSATVSNLQPRVMYTVKVQAVTAGGPGPSSRSVQVKTQHGIPGQVTGVIFPFMSMDSFRVRWTAPAIATHPVTGYKLYYNGSDGTYGHMTACACCRARIHLRS